jgi:hypothetical protein
VSDLAQALMVAIRVHAGQRDKRGEPYLLHVLRVIEAVGDDAKVVAALHDVLEDADGPGGMCLAGLVAYCHLSMAEEAALDALTRREGEAYALYIQRIIAVGGIASRVKLADLRDNLGRIPTVHRPEDARRWAPLARRYERAIETLEASC